MSAPSSLPLDERVALVHDFFVQDGGAERCAVALARIFPRAPVYTSFFDDNTFGSRVDPDRVRTWPFQRALGGRRFRSLLPLYPLYFSTLDLRAAEVVVSSSVAFAKGVRTSPDALHISYIHTPMRYAWALGDYLRGSSYPAVARVAARAMQPALAAWDLATARRPDVLVANSESVRQRIRRLWRREALVIHPPVDVAEFSVTGRDDGFLLVASRLLAYRRLDVAVRAASLLGRELIVVGDGPERRRLEALAGPTVSFTGHLARAQLVDLFQRCHAYVLPGAEDFGIAPVEAMASGKPVVAFRRGGATETVVEGITGVFFDEPSVGSLAAAIERLDGVAFDPLRVRARAERFDRSVFEASFGRLLAGLGVPPELYVPGSAEARPF